MFYSLIFFCLFLPSCMPLTIDDEYTKLSNKIESKFTKQICKGGEYSLICRGGRVTDEVQITYLTFKTIAAVGISQARQIIVEKEEEFLSLLNGSEEIRPYLLRYPSCAESLELDIGFKDLKGEFAAPPHIALVSVYKNKISYDIFDFETRSFTTVFFEPYEEGYRIVYGKEK